MAITSKVITSKAGIAINILNNGSMMIQSLYSPLMRLLSTTKFDSTGIEVTKFHTYTYNTAGQRITEHVVSGKGDVIEDIDFSYTNGKLSTMTHYNSLGTLTATDFFTNGIFTGMTLVKTIPVIMPSVIVAPPIIPITTISTISAPTIPVPLSTPIWNNVYGHGEINMIKSLSLIGTKIVDVLTKHQWGLQIPHFDDSTDAGYIGTGVVIANIDTGIDLNNKALTSNLSKFNWNFLNNTANVQDDNGHGSFTASQMIATDIGNGIVGAATGSQLMTLKAMDSNGNGTAANVAKAIVYAVDNGADIINLSLNSKFNLPAIDSALVYASTHNVLVTISSGNGLGVGPQAPATNALTLDNVLAVGGSQNLATGLAYNASGNSAGTSKEFNYVVAPSVGIKGYDNAGTIITKQGTSMASAYTASAMAILESAYTKSNIQASIADISSAVMDAITNGTDSISIVGSFSAQLAAI